MGWNGDGTFSRDHNWQQDADNDIDIVPDRHDGEDDNFATGIQACLAKNGENAATNNLPMGGFRHTNVGDATARDQYATAKQLQDSNLDYSADTGAADAYVMTLSPAITAYAAGAEYRFKAVNANTGASTLNINGVGAANILKNNTDALVAGDIQAGDIVTVVYDGTAFQMRSATTVPDYAGTARRAGWIPAKPGDITTNTTLNTSHVGNITRTVGTLTVTVPASITGGNDTVQLIVASGTLTVSDASLTELRWLAGGSVTTGSRTVAVGSAVTIWYFASGFAYIWGNGIS